MTSRSESEKQKQIQAKCQAILGNLLREEDNKYCVDCDAKGPRWASWNLGIFLCIRCAGIHRNLGVHISKVKSVNLDTWTPEQVACLQQMGNSQARAVYEANLPDSFRRPQTESSLEAFIRSKYEQKKYIAKEWVPPPPPKPAFDIDEEKKKEKERKKTRVKALGAVEIPPLPQQPPVALPRPHSSAQPTPLSKTQELNEINLKKPDSSSADLLTLGDVSSNQQCDDIFDAFLSAPRPETSTSSPATTGADTISTATSKSYDTTDLFNEMAAPTASQSKMTKESILSLYGSSQSQQPLPQVPPVYGLPSGMYISQQGYAAVGVNRFPSIPNQPVLANGYPGAVSQVAGIQQIQQQMSNLQLQGQVWNSSAVSVSSVPSSGVMLSQDTTTNVAYSAGRGLPSNFWQ